MQKVSFFKSIHVKLVLIYVLLIIIALQIIGIYFSKQLEENLKTNFQDSIRQRIELVHYSIREESRIYIHRGPLKQQANKR